jgi:hypothetical protein
MSVNEYITKFTQLSRYAPHEVDTDEKKQECFLNGLNDGLDYTLEAQEFENFQGMVNKALVLENRRGMMERKCKLVRLEEGRVEVDGALRGRQGRGRRRAQRKAGSRLMACSEEGKADGTLEGQVEVAACFGEATVDDRWRRLWRGGF